MLSCPQARALLHDADVVLALGTELAGTDSWIERLDFGGRLIRVDIDPAKLTDVYPAALGIHADAGATAARIAAALGSGRPAPTRAEAAWAEAGARIARVRSQILDRPDPLAARHQGVLDALRQALPENAVVVTDMTQIAYSGHVSFPVSRPDGWLHPNV